MSLLAQQFGAWSKGLHEEIEFWDRWMATKGLEWPHEFKRRIEGSASISERIIEGLDDPRKAKFLDVGAGPITALGTKYSGEPIDLICVDPLAPYYRELGRKHDVAVTVRQAFAEDLTAAFEENTFDRTTCSNALDHSFDPLRGIEEMIRVTKVEGRIFLDHSINEAEFENYTGFHRWNFDEANGKFIIWNAGGQRIDVNAAFEGICSFTVTIDRERRRHSVTGIKLRDFADVGLERIRARNQEAFAGFLDLLKGMPRKKRTLFDKVKAKIAAKFRLK